MEKKEIVWIDWLKFICMFFVYWCHIEMLGDYKNDLKIPYEYFFVNSFFFISGYLIFSKYLDPNNFIQSRKVFFKEQIKRNGFLSSVIFKIAIPSVIFSMIDYIPKALIRSNSISTSGFIFDTFLRGTNWFTCALCITEIVIFVLLLTRSKNIWIYVLLSVPFFLLGNYLVNRHFIIYRDEYFPWFYKNGLIACLLITLGGVFFKYEGKVDLIMRSLGGRLSAIILFIIYCLISIFKPFGVIKASALTGFNVEGIFICLLAIISLVYICKIFPHNSAVVFVSRHSIGFFFLSASVPFVWCKVVGHFLSSDFFSFIIGVLGSFITSWFVVYLLNKYLPFLFDLRKLKTKS